MGISDHLTCLLRNLYAGQEATVRTEHGPKDWFQIGEGVCQDCLLLSCLFNLYAEYIMRNSKLDEAQARMKIPRRNINTSYMQMTPPLWQKVKKERNKWKEGTYFKITQKTYSSLRKYLTLYIEWLNVALYKLIL